MKHPRFDAWVLVFTEALFERQNIFFCFWFAESFPILIIGGVYVEENLNHHSPSALFFFVQSLPPFERSLQFATFFFVLRQILFLSLPRTISVLWASTIFCSERSSL